MDFSEWTLKAIREEGSCFSWMEEYRFNWIPQAKNAILKIIEGQSVIIVTDKKYRWLSNYIINRINQLENNRPFIPVYTIESLFPKIKSLQNSSEMDYLYDMLDISFANGYFFWYIGDGKHTHFEHILQDKASLIWQLNHEIEGIFTLNRNDKDADIKLIQAFKLFEKAIDAALIGEIEI